MFLKLVKHELRAAVRALFPLLCGLLVMALLTQGSFLLRGSTGSSTNNLITALMIFMFILSCIAMVVTTMILMMVRFKRSVHGDEGYLTHTLPVGVHSILLSRLLISFLAMAVSYAAVYIGVRIAFYQVKLVDAIIDLSIALIAIGVEEGLLLQGFALLAVSFLNMILMIFAAISIGHSFATGKVLKSVLFWFALYALQVVVTTMITFVIYDDQALTSLSGNEFWFSAGLDVVFCIIYYFLTWYMTKNRLNLE